MATSIGRLTGRLAVPGLLGVGARRSAQERADARLGLLLAAPAVLTILVIAVIPLAGTIWDSLFRLSLRFENAPRPFVGLDNYVSALSDDAWYNALSVTGPVPSEICLRTPLRPSVCSTSPPNSMMARVAGVNEPSARNPNLLNLAASSAAPEGLS